MLKSQCHLAFIRSYARSKATNRRFFADIGSRICFNSETVAPLRRKANHAFITNRNRANSEKAWTAFPKSTFIQKPCRFLVQYTKEARISSDTFTKPGGDLNIGANVGLKQDEVIHEKVIGLSHISWKQRIKLYLKLSKIRLTGLVVLTTMAGYSLAPGEFSATTFLLASLGTMLCSCSANTINQWLEVPFDSQMSRTKKRALVRGLLSPTEALLFGVIAGTSGLTILGTQVNGLTALLGATTLLLYTSVYTPLKRISIANTWVGSVVGALPPLMGWTACTGTLDLGALLLGGILYSWQFPHFNALSWNLRADYSRAGHRMMSVLNPELCRKVALRHCVSLVALTSLLPACEVTTWWLALDSLPVNLWFTWLAWKFYKQSDNKSARELFRFSLLHLPILMFLVLFHKKPKDNERAEFKEPIAV